MFFHSFPASSVLRASPPSHTAWPVSRELPVDPYCNHRWDFPCCAWSPLRTCRRQYPGRSNGTCSLVQFHSLRPSHELWAGRLLHHYFRGLLSVHSRYSLHARRVALATLCTRGFSSLVTSTAALIATGWSEPVPGRVYPRCGPAPSRRTRVARQQCWLCSPQLHPSQLPLGSLSLPCGSSVRTQYAMVSGAASNRIAAPTTPASENKAGGLLPNQPAQFRTRKL